MIRVPVDRGAYGISGTRKLPTTRWDSVLIQEIPMLFQILFGVYTVDVGVPIQLVRLESGELYFIADLVHHPNHHFTAGSEAKHNEISWLHYATVQLGL